MPSELPFQRHGGVGEADRKRRVFMQEQPRRGARREQSKYTRQPCLPTTFLFPFLSLLIHRTWDMVTQIPCGTENRKASTDFSHPKMTDSMEP